MFTRMVRRRRCLTAIAAVAVVASFDSAVFADAVSSHPFVEYLRWATIADVVAISRFAAGDLVIADGIRMDVDNDGMVSERDAELLADYVCGYGLRDAVLQIADCEWFVENENTFRMEMCSEFNTPFEYSAVFHDIRPDQILWLYPDYVMIDRIFTVADGGMTGYAVQADPYCGDILYDTVYETGDIVVFYNVFVEGNPSRMVRSKEIKVGNVADLGFTYEPRQEIVDNALRNLE